MPIRFRCAYCNQLMGIAQRKAGTVVSCPKCQGQVMVPDPEDAGAADMGAADNGAESSPPSFEDADFDKQLVAAAAEVPADHIQVVDTTPVKQHPPVPWSPAQSTPEMSGVFLTPGLMVLVGVLVVLLMGVAFFVGLLVGRGAG